MLHVAFICTPCCMLLRVVVATLLGQDVHVVSRLHVNIGENLTAQLNVERQQVLHTFEVPPHVHPFCLQGAFSQATFISKGLVRN